MNGFTRRMQLPFSRRKLFESPLKTSCVNYAPVYREFEELVQIPSSPRLIRRWQYRRYCAISASRILVSTVKRAKGGRP
jgi:hypothetical protein